MLHHIYHSVVVIISVSLHFMVMKFVCLALFVGTCPDFLTSSRFFWWVQFLFLTNSILFWWVRFFLTNSSFFWWVRFFRSSINFFFDFILIFFHNYGFFLSRLKLDRNRLRSSFKSDKNENRNRNENTTRTP